MRQVMAKEMRDLAPVALVAGLAAAGIGYAIALEQRFPLPGLAMLCASLGAGAGIAQGLLDRARRDDPFLLHRPESAVRIHAARGVVGAALAAAPAALAAAVVPLAAPDERWRPPANWFGAWADASVRTEIGVVEALTCVAAAVVLHAVARLALAARNVVATALLLVVLPVCSAYALLSVETAAPPWPLLVAFIAAVSALTTLQISRRPA